MRTIFLTASAAALLGACATDPTQTSRYQQDLDRLTAECEADGGILIPIEGQLTGNAATDFACRTRNASRLD